MPLSCRGEHPECYTTPGGHWGGGGTGKFRPCEKTLLCPHFDMTPKSKNTRGKFPALVCHSPIRAGGVSWSMDYIFGTIFYISNFLRFARIMYQIYLNKMWGFPLWGMSKWGTVEHSHLKDTVASLRRENLVCVVWRLGSWLGSWDPLPPPPPQVNAL